MIGGGEDINKPSVEINNNHIPPTTNVTLLMACTAFFVSSSFSDPNTYGMTRVNRSVGGDTSLRLQNLQLVVNSILHFYLSSQQQLVLAPLPDIDTIAHKPESGMALYLCAYF